jgi:hypothetical protein
VFESDRTKYNRTIATDDNPLSDDEADPDVYIEEPDIDDTQEVIQTCVVRPRICRISNVYMMFFSSIVYWVRG